MTTTFIITSILEAIAVALVITGFVFEDKLVDFEEKLKDKLAKKIAAFIMNSRLTRDLVETSISPAQSRAKTEYVFDDEPSTPVPTKKVRAGGRVA